MPSPSALRINKALHLGCNNGNLRPFLGCVFAHFLALTAQSEEHSGAPHLCCRKKGRTVRRPAPRNTALSVSLQTRADTWGRDLSSLWEKHQHSQSSWLGLVTLPRLLSHCLLPTLWSRLNHETRMAKEACRQPEGQGCGLTN